MEKALHYTRIVLVLLTILVCLLLCWQAVDIYQTGNAPENFSSPGVRIHPVWSRDIVGARLAAISPALILWLVAVIASIALKVSVSEPEKIVSPPREMLDLLKARVHPLPPDAAKLEQQRRTVWIAAIAVSAICAVPCVVYLVQASHFADRDLEKTMGAMLLALLPWLLIAFAALLAASLFESKSISKEVSLLQKAPKSAPVSTSQPHKSPVPVQAAVLVLSLVLILLGIFNGGAWDVLVKAVNICTECIGLG